MEGPRMPMGGPPRPHYPEGPRHPGPGPAHMQQQQPLRPIPPHLQRPAYEQSAPMQPPRSLNPIDDLVETEKEYVADLKVLLQRVSAGWTSDDLPPQEVDNMLRNVEEIYSINRKLSKKLADVHSSEDAITTLGQILTWFIDNMENTYSNYCKNHIPYLDNWPEIVNNGRLQDILAQIAAEQFQHVTLDTFMMKPIERLQYYRRVFMRVLEGSERGTPDFEALESAFMRLDAILRIVNIDVPGTSRHPASPALSGISSMSALRNALPSPPIQNQEQTSPNFPPRGGNPVSPALPPSPMSPGMNPHNNQQKPPQGPPTADEMQALERELDTAQVLDLFTMQPKACALSLAMIERHMVMRGDFRIDISSGDGINERFDDGHVLLLSDLLLICRVKSPEEVESNPEGIFSTFWLLFPPLAIRHVTADDGTIDEHEPIVELNIVNRVKARIFVPNHNVKQDWLHFVNDCQGQDAAKAQGLQRNQTINQGGHGGPPPRPMMGPPISPMSPRFDPNGAPMSPPFPGGPGGPGGPGRPPMLAMGGPHPPMMQGPPGSPGFRPPMSPMSPGRPMMGPGGPGVMNNRPPMNNHRMSMRRNNTLARSGTRGRVVAKGDAVAAREVMYKSRPCDVFQWRDEWDPLVEDDDVIVELRLTTSNRLAMAVTTLDSNQLVLNAWIVPSTIFRRSSETDISVSMDMGNAVHWYLVALNSVREADDFCMAFQRTKERAMHDPSLMHSQAPVLSRGDSLASTVVQPKPAAPVKQTQSAMHPPAEIKLYIQAGDHGQWVNLGTARCEIRMEKPSGYVKLYVMLMDKQRRVIDNVIVTNDCLELVGPKKLAITLMNAQEKMSIIYMLQFKDETLTTKFFEGLSLNNPE